MSGYREIEQDIKGGALDGVGTVLLHGPEAFLVSHYEGRLAALFGGDGPGAKVDRAAFFGDEAEDDDIIRACEPMPMFSPRRVVIVRGHAGLASAGGAGGGESGGGQKAAKAKRGDQGLLADYLPKVPESAKLILTAAAVNKTKALYKAAAKHGKVYEFERLGDADLFAFAAKRFKQAGVAAPPSLVEEFLARTGYTARDATADLFLVDGEAAKIGAYVRAQGRDTLTRDDISACMGPDVDADIFKLVDAISARQKSEAICLLEHSLAGGESVFRLLPRIIEQFETMLGYKEMDAKGGYTDAKMLALLPVKFEWQLRKLKPCARKFDMRTLEEALLRLYGIEAAIKSGDLPEELALTLFVADL